MFTLHAGRGGVVPEFSRLPHSFYSVGSHFASCNHDHTCKEDFGGPFLTVFFFVGP